ncbi:MAG TPA: hypothetical protein VML55_02855 [Planctomycetaceae bacterium]|nr:hypothetical protein [Planctomycetaceae bacterium]
MPHAIRMSLVPLVLSAVIVQFAASAPAQTVVEEHGPPTEPSPARPGIERGDAALSDPARDTESPPSKTDPAEPDADRSKLDTDLLRGLLGKRPDQDLPADNPLERAVRGMRTAHERIAGRDTSPETRGIQEQVIEDLAQLIELARQPPPPRQNNQPPPPTPQDSDSQDQQSQQDDSQAPPGENEQESPSATQQQQSDQARESAERDAERRAREAELKRRQNLVDGVWGHLPPSVRQKILSGGGDEYLRDYEHVARRYFEALAEQGASGAR